MDKIFQRLVVGSPAELSGLTVDARISISEELANEIIVVALQGDPHVAYCHAQIHSGNRIALDVKSSRWPWPFHVKLKLFSAVDVAHSPTIRAFLENHVLLGKLGSLFHVLPDGIHFYEDQIAVDIGAFINSGEQKMLLSLIETAEIRTEEGSLFIDIAIQK